MIFIHNLISARWNFICPLEFYLPVNFLPVAFFAHNFSRSHSSRMLWNLLTTSESLLSIKKTLNHHSTSQPAAPQPAAPHPTTHRSASSHSQPATLISHPLFSLTLAPLLSPPPSSLATSSHRSASSSLNLSPPIGLLITRNLIPLISQVFRAARREHGSRGSSPVVRTARRPPPPVFFVGILLLSARWGC